MSDRIASLRRLAASHDVDGLLIAHPPDLRWAVGFTGSNGLLLVTETTAHFVTDGRYTTQAAAEVDGPDPGEPPPVSDIDAALAQTDDGPPDDVEARVDRHLSLLHGWLDAAGPPPRQDAPV